MIYLYFNLSFQWRTGQQESVSPKSISRNEILPSIDQTASSPKRGILRSSILKSAVADGSSISSGSVADEMEDVVLYDSNPTIRLGGLPRHINVPSSSSDSWGNNSTSLIIPNDQMLV